MTDKLFNRLWQDALAQPDKELYIAEYGYPEWFDDISNDITEVARILGDIHDVAHMGVKEIALAAGISQRALALKFCIPIRTMENWACGQRECADYIRLMMAEHLGFIKR